MAEPIRILCVDDEVNILNVVRRQLDDDLFQVHTALTVAEGVRILRQTQPVHVVLSDYRLPGGNGMDFLRLAVRKWPDTVGIILSGFADLATVQQASEQGDLFRFIAKPWQAAELRAAIIEAAARSNAGRKARSPS